MPTVPVCTCWLSPTYCSSLPEMSLWSVSLCFCVILVHDGWVRLRFLALYWIYEYAEWNKPVSWPIYFHWLPWHLQMLFFCKVIGWDWKWFLRKVTWSEFSLCISAKWRAVERKHEHYQILNISITCFLLCCFCYCAFLCVSWIRSPSVGWRTALNDGGKMVRKWKVIGIFHRTSSDTRKGEE